jgi:hypothetical protein
MRRVPTNNVILAHFMKEPRLNDVVLEGKYVLRMTSFCRCYLSCKFIRYCKKKVMDEMTLISMHIYHIEVNHFKYEIICQNMQEKNLTFVCGLDQNIRTSETRPLAVTRQASLPPNGRVYSERISRSELQHMTDIIILKI